MLPGSLPALRCIDMGKATLLLLLLTIVGFEAEPIGVILAHMWVSYVLVGAAVVVVVMGGAGGWVVSWWRWVVGGG